MRDSSFSVEVTVVLMFCGERETKRKDVEKKKRDHAPVGGDQAAGGRGCKGLGYLPAAWTHWLFFSPLRTTWVERAAPPEESKRLDTGSKIYQRYFAQTVNVDGTPRWRGHTSTASADPYLLSTYTGVWGGGGVGGVSGGAAAVTDVDPSPLLWCPRSRISAPQALSFLSCSPTHFILLFWQD